MLFSHMLVEVGGKDEEGGGEGEDKEEEEGEGGLLVGVGVEELVIEVVMVDAIDLVIICCYCYSPE